MLGKTTVLTMITKQTIAQGEKVFYFNGEQTKEDFKNNIYIQSSSPKDLYDIYYKDTAIKDTFVKEIKRMELDRQYGDTLFIYNNEGPRDIQSILFAMEDCRRVYGTRVFILDNFMQIDMKTQDVYQEQSNAMEKLRTFAVNKNVHIHLVAHPRKMNDFQTRLSLYDISGSMNLANKAYNVISIIRVDMMDEESKEYQTLAKKLLLNRYEIKETSTILEVLKTKGTACGIVPLVFDKETKTYKEQSWIPSEIWEKAKYESNKSNKLDFN